MTSLRVLAGGCSYAIYEGGGIFSRVLARSTIRWNFINSIDSGGGKGLERQREGGREREIGRERERGKEGGREGERWGGREREIGRERERGKEGGREGKEGEGEGEGTHNTFQHNYKDTVYA